MLACAPDVGRARPSAPIRRGDRVRRDAPAWAAWLAAQLADARSSWSWSRADDAARARARGRPAVLSWAASAMPTELDPIASLPGIDVSPYADLSPDRSCIVERVATLYRLTPARAAAAHRRDARPRRWCGARVPPAELAARGRRSSKGETDRSRRARRAARRRRLDAHAGRRRARHVRGPRRRDRRVRAARAAPGPHRAVRRRGRVAALVRRRVAAHAAPGRSRAPASGARDDQHRRARRAHAAARRTPTRSRSRRRRRAG